jgi:hypothetical protein
VTEDIFSTIDVLNKDSETVFTSPIKRLANVSFSRLGVNWKGSMTRSVARKNQGTVDKASYVFSPADMLVRACTKRSSDDLYDILHFRTVIVLSAEAVMEFMKELCSSKSHKFLGWDGTGPVERFEHNQITILEFNISPVDRLSGEHKMYRYGDDAVVELELTCEYLLDRVAYDSVKPKAVKAEILGKKEAAEKNKFQSSRGTSKPKKPREK